MLDLSSVRGQRRLNRLLKLDSDSHSLNDGQVGLVCSCFLVTWTCWHVQEIHLEKGQTTNNDANFSNELVKTVYE